MFQKSTWSSERYLYVPAICVVLCIISNAIIMWFTACLPCLPQGQAKLCLCIESVGSECTKEISFPHTLFMCHLHLARSGRSMATVASGRVGERGVFYGKITQFSTGLFLCYLHCAKILCTQFHAGRPILLVSLFLFTKVSACRNTFLIQGCTVLKLACT